MQITETYRIQTDITDQLTDLTKDQTAVLTAALRSVNAAPVEIITDKTSLRITRPPQNARAKIETLQDTITEQISDLFPQHLDPHTADTLKNRNLPEALGRNMIDSVRDRLNKLVETQTLTYDEMPTEARNTLTLLCARIDEATLDPATTPLDIEIVAIAETSDQIPTTVTVPMKNPFDFVTFTRAPTPIGIANLTLPTALMVSITHRVQKDAVRHPWHRYGTRTATWADRKEAIQDPQARPFEQLYQRVLKHQSLAMNLYRDKLDR